MVEKASIASLFAALAPATVASEAEAVVKFEVTVLMLRATGEPLAVSRMILNRRSAPQTTGLAETWTVSVLPLRLAAPPSTPRGMSTSPLVVAPLVPLKVAAMASEPAPQ